MSRRSRSRSPRRKRHGDDGDGDGGTRDRNREKENRIYRTALNSKDDVERMETSERKSSRISPVRSIDEGGRRRRRGRGLEEEESARRGEGERRREREQRNRRMGEGGGRRRRSDGDVRGMEGGRERERNRTDKFRNERKVYPMRRPRDGERLEGQAPSVPGSTNTGDNQVKDRHAQAASPGPGDEKQSPQQTQQDGEEVQVLPEGEEIDPDSSKLYESLTDPQDVPRSGFFFEHDNREEDAHRLPPRRRFSERPPVRRERREPDRRRNDDRNLAREGRSGARDGHDDRRKQRDQRLRSPRDSRHSGERRDSWEDRHSGERRDSWEDRHSGERRDRRLEKNWRDRRPGDDRRLAERRQRSPARWRHDLFEDDVEETTVAEENKSGGIDGTWSHDKYQEQQGIDAES